MASSASPVCLSRLTPFTLMTSTPWNNCWDFISWCQSCFALKMMNGLSRKKKPKPTVDSHASLLFLLPLSPSVSLSLSAALFEQVGQSKWCVGGEALSRIDGCVNRQQSHIDCEDFGTRECKRSGEHRYSPSLFLQTLSVCHLFSTQFVCFLVRKCAKMLQHLDLCKPSQANSRSLLWNTTRSQKHEETVKTIRCLPKYFSFRFLIPDKMLWGGFATIMWRGERYLMRFVSCY